MPWLRVRLASVCSSDDYRHDSRGPSAHLLGLVFLCCDRVAIDVDTEDLSHDATVQPPATGSGLPFIRCDFDQYLRPLIGTLPS